MPGTREAVSDHVLGNSLLFAVLSAPETGSLAIFGILGVPWPVFSLFAIFWASRGQFTRDLRHAAPSTPTLDLSRPLQRAVDNVSSLPKPPFPMVPDRSHGQMHASSQGALGLQLCR